MANIVKGADSVAKGVQEYWSMSVDILLLPLAFHQILSYNYQHLVLYTTSCSSSRLSCIGLIYLTITIISLFPDNPSSTTPHNNRTASHVWQLTKDYLIYFSKKFKELLDKIENSNLNYVISKTPFSATILSIVLL